MKNNLIKTGLLLMIVALLSLFSCRPDDENIKIEDPKENPEAPGGNQGPSVGKVTDIGSPVGTLETTTIGPAGGSFVTSDQRLKIEVPQGTFSSDQVITVQPITNENGPGIGLAYRITPHDVAFSKPVKLTFKYAEEDIITSAPEALGIAYQDENKIWKALGGSVLDTVSKAISVTTTHFSDWSVFLSFDLFPPTSVLNPGETVQLELMGYLLEDIGVSLKIGDEMVIVEPRDLTPFVKEWTLAGAGTLTPNGSKAVYTAPAITPKVNPVAISLELKLNQPGRFFLVRNILIGQEGIYLKLDNEEYFHMHGQVHYLAPADMSVLTGGTAVDGQNKGISIHWQGKLSINTFTWTEKMPLFNYNYDARYMYLHYFQKTVSPGKLEITGYGEVDGYVTGTFQLEASGLLDTQAKPGQDAWLRKGKIQGYFRVKRKA
jgi:hypothetical protein